MREADFLVVGAGFAGSVCARALADAGCRVTVIDRREHIGGNAYDHVDEHGLSIHRYGPHIFHTNSERVFAFLSRFTAWRPYEHRVLAVVDGQFVPFPINRTTLSRVYGEEFDEAGAGALYERVREKRRSLETSEDVVLSSIGPDLCDKFFRGYSRKQWGMELSQLSAQVVARVPARTNDDDRYFTDRFQYMPAAGYHAMFVRMLDDARITVELDCDFQTLRRRRGSAHVVYTGPVDAYFDRCHGRLPYRSLSFEHEHLRDRTWFQSVGTVNYPNDHAFTRITEFKHLTSESHDGTSIVREYPQAEGDPYYPIPIPANAALYARYRALARRERGVTFVGRLAQYRYFNMDQVVGAALEAANRLLEGSR